MITEAVAPRAISTKAKGSLRRMTNVLSSVASIVVTKLASAWPIVSRTIQRFSEGITSLVLTGWPSWKFEAGPQGKGIHQPVRRNLVALDHLRLRPELRIPRKERVVDHVPVHNGDRRRVGVRIGHFEVGMRHDPQHLVRRARATYRREKGQQQKCCPQAADRHSIPFTRKPARI